MGQLAEKLRREGFTVSYTTRDFWRDFVKEHLPELTPGEREEVLKALPPEERLAGLPPEERLPGVPPEQRLAGLPPEERLAGLSPEQIRQYLDRLTAERPAARRKPRRKK